MTDDASGGRTRLRQRSRVAAYGVCVRDGQVLLARLAATDLGEPSVWTVPGGGLDHGEDPVDAVVREVEEETGYRVRVERLLGIRSHRDNPSAAGDDYHRLGIVYEVTVTGGELRYETDGSTDLAAWTDPGTVPALERSPLVDFALDLHQRKPPTGRFET